MDKKNRWMVGWIEKSIMKKYMDGWKDKKKRKNRWMVGWIKNL